MERYFDYLAVLLTIAAAFWHFFAGRRRTARDVLLDLEESEERVTLRSPRRKKDPICFIPFLTVVGALLLRLFFGATGLTGLIVTVLFSFSLGVFIMRGVEKARKRKHQDKINFFLPLVMERVVMAVQAGLDILPAIGAILKIEDAKPRHMSSVEEDPVCKLLERVRSQAESGLTLDESLRKVAESVENAALRHAFIHLSVAYREGGELVMPLRELSDATQLFYQEIVEENIAKMPIKATMPLLLTFAGLIICFITSPIIQILEILQDAMP